MLSRIGIAGVLVIFSAGASNSAVVSDYSEQFERNAPPKLVQTQLAQSSLSRNEIRLLQSQLLRQGYAPGPADGSAGNQTREAATAYQRDRKLPQDGGATRELLTQLTNYVDVGEVELVGSAVAVGDGFRLTPPSRQPQVGAVWLISKQLVADGFQTDFQFRASNRVRLPENGFAFVIQNSGGSAIGQDDPGAGYAGIANSIAVEFGSGTNGDHVAIRTRGRGPNAGSQTALVAQNSLSLGFWGAPFHTVRIDYLPGTFAVFLDGDLIVEVALNLAEILALDDGKAWTGFTASAKSNIPSHDILYWSVDSAGKEGQVAAARAETRIGDMFSRGEDVQPNKAMSAIWYRSAAEKNFAVAQYKLGRFYMMGVGVPRDFPEAVKWFRAAAEQAHVEAQYQLAYSYANGVGVQRNYATALEWYRRAAAQGYKDAAARADALDKIIRLLAIRSASAQDAWNAVKDTRSREVLETYVSLFPEGIYTPSAKELLIQLGDTAPGSAATAPRMTPIARVLEPQIYDVRTIETWIDKNSIGESTTLNAQFFSVISGDNVPGGQVRLEYNLVGSYRYDQSNFQNLEIIIKEPLGFDEPDYLDECPGSQTSRWNDKLYRVQVSFQRLGRDLQGIQLDCIISMLPEDQAFKVRFITRSLRDIAIGMMISGYIEKIQHTGLRQWIPRVATGEIRVQ